jgi:integrase
MVEKRESARLTEKRLARAVAAKKKAILRDPSVQGFGVQVGARGGATFFLRYGGKAARRYLTIGRWSDEFDVENARKLATELAGRIARGEDPVAARKQETAQAVTFAEWVVKYHERTDARRKEKKTPAYYLKLAAKRWAKRPLHSITLSDILDFRGAMVKLGAGSDKREYAGHATGNRATAFVAACFAQAVKENVLDRNPAVGAGKLPERDPRQRIATDDEMKALLAALDDLEAKGDTFTALAFFVAVETGARISEVLRTRWADISIEDGAWRIVRAKSGRPRVVALASQTVERLERAKEQATSEWLIPARTSDEIHRADLKKEWARLQEDAELGDLHLHDVRRSFGARMTKLAGLHMASRALGHESIRTTEKIYSPLSLADQRAAVEAATRVLPFKKPA